MKRTILFLIMLFVPVMIWAQEESLEALKERADQGDGAALLRLSRVYADGEFGVEPDNQMAHSYLVRATEAGDPFAYYEMAKHYKEDPWGILEPDAAMERLYLERAAEQNHLVAILLLSNYETTYEGKLGVFLRMIEVTPLAGTEGAEEFAKDEIFEYLAGFRTLEGDTYDPSAPNATRAMEWLRSEAEAGDMVREQQLGAVYWQMGDKAKGRFWLLKAAEHGDSVAAYFLASTVYTSDNSPFKDPAESVKWLIRAAEGGHAEAQYWLGASYNPRAGELYPVGEKDIWLSIQWYERAAAQGHHNAQFDGGVQITNYAKDIRNKKESYAIGAHGIRLLEMAVENGNMDAAFGLGLSYGLGYGVKPSNKMRNYYCGIAARGGHEKAIEFCRQFNIPY